MFKSLFLPCLALLLFSTFRCMADPVSGGVDAIVFGDEASEKAHRFESNASEAVTAALTEPARVSLPTTPVDYYGGDLSFEMKVDPVLQNYFTVKFWGSDVNGGQKALLYIDGEQLGYRHLGDYEALNHGAGEPSFRGRFFYATAVIPLSKTHGRSSLPITIRTIGPISGYQLGGGYDGYQKKMTERSRGYYRAYTHTSPALAGLELEKQGDAPAAPAIRPPAVEKKPKADDQTPSKRLSERVASTGMLSPNDIASFAGTAADEWPKLDSATRKQVLDRLVATIDLQSANAYNPTFFEKGIYQGDWGGSFAPVATAILEMKKFVTAEQWQKLFKESIVVKDGKQTRRAAWTRMINGNFDYARTHLARITNQAMFCLNGAYRSNLAQQIIDPSVAEPESTAKRFLLAAAGLAPYRGNDILDATGKLVGHEDPFGSHYLQITEKGLTREFTYVAIYGEIANDLVHYWEEYGGDDILKKALISANARAQMKYSDFDENGYRGMRMEGVIESRGPAYPDDVGYVQRRRGLTLMRLPRLMAEHPEKYAGAEWAPYRQIAKNIIGYGQQMLADNQKPEGDPKDLAFLKAQLPTGILLPNTNLKWYSADEIAKLKAAGLNVADLERHAWADEDNGTIALRDGDLTMFVGLVMKANWGINGIARVHCMTSTIDRLATVAPDVQYEWGGKWSVRPDWTNVQFMNANNPPEGPIQALEGEILPFAVQPTVQPTAPVDNPYVGYGNFYSLRYLKYLIGMNTTRAAYGNARNYSLRLPSNFSGASVFDFISKKELPVKNGIVEVAPQSTVILEMKDDADPQPLPSTPRLVAAFAANEGAVTLRWQHAGGAASYIVKRGPSAAGPWQEIGRLAGENTFSDPTPGDKPYYVVSGVNQFGTGADSPATAVIPNDPALLAWLDRKPVDPASPPDAPRALQGENIKKEIQLKWKVALRGATYEVLRAEKADGPFAPVASNLTTVSWKDSNIEYGKHYFYKIVATNRSGIRGPETAPIDFSPVDDPLQKPWESIDIGDIGKPGVDGQLDDTFAIRGAGNEVWGNVDSFHFVYQKLAGDGTITARITAQRNTDNWARSGVMFRESLEPGSANSFLFTTPGYGIVSQNRPQTGAVTSQTKHPLNADLPLWLQLVRKGGQITASISKNGETWTQVEQYSMTAPGPLFVGLAVASKSKESLNLTRFDHVSLVP